MENDLSISISPVNFFQFNIDLHKITMEPLASLGKRLYKETYRLSDFSVLCGGPVFAEFYLGWSQEGIAAHVLVHEPFRRSSYPNVVRGDSIELFLDTRDVKTSGFNTRYCHHFFCLPEAV